MVYSSTNVDGEFKSLLSIGIGSGDTGRNYESTMKGLIKLDEDKLREALNNNPEDVWKLFATNDKTNEKYGVAQKYRIMSMMSLNLMAILTELPALTVR